MRFFSTVAKVTVFGFGSAYVGIQASRYDNYRKKMTKYAGKLNCSRHEKNIPPLSGNGNWLVYSRHPYTNNVPFMFQPFLTKLDSMGLKDTRPAFFLKKVFGTRMLNEGAVQKFNAGADKGAYEVQLFSNDREEPRRIVTVEQMLKTDWNDIEDEMLFEIGFARKRFFSDSLPQLYHSAIALRPCSEIEPPQAQHIVMKGWEIKKILEETELQICNTQHYNPLKSNSNSASIYFLLKIETHCLNKAEDIRKMHPLIADATLENLGRGAINNPMVVAELNKMFLFVKKHITQQEIALQKKDNGPGKHPG